MGYPLVNVYKKRWTIPPCFMGKLTISTGPFSIANYVCLPEGIYRNPFPVILNTHFETMVQ